MMVEISTKTGRTVGLEGPPIDWATRQGLSLVYLLARYLIGSTLIDAGAYVGAYTVLAGLVPGMAVHAFEPNPRVLPLLLENVARNQLERQVMVHDFALLDRPKMAMLSQPHRRNRRGLATLASVRFRKGTVCRVEALSLDRCGLKMDILKLDVEGAELAVLKGGQYIINRWAPAILAETQDKRTRQFGYNVEEIFHLLEGWGYRSQKVTRRDTFFWRRQAHDPKLWFNDKERKTCLRFIPS